MNHLQFRGEGAGTAVPSLPLFVKPPPNLPPLGEGFIYLFRKGAVFLIPKKTKITKRTKILEIKFSLHSLLQYLEVSKKLFIFAS